MRLKFLSAFILMLLIISPAFSDSYEEHEKKFIAFYESVEKAANQICWSGEYNLQDVEFVRNEMLGDERVYARAWYADYYLVIRKYNDKKWSSSFVSHFSTTSEELTFINGIKVGAPFSKVEEFFGKEHIYGNSTVIRTIAQYEESDGGGMLMFTVENGIITSISYALLDNMTSKMSSLFDLYSSLYIGEVTGEKVNVRDYPPDGKVRFQVSKSRGDRLLVDIEERNEGWYAVAGRLVRNKLENVPYCYISKQFVNVRKLTHSERKFFILQIFPHSH